MKNQDNPSRRRNADTSRRLLIEAVGKVLVDKGYTHCTPAEIARTAGVDKKLINYYFGSVNNLLKTYIHERDFWMPVFREFETPDNPRDYIFGVLKDQLEYFLRNEEMQQFVHWQISEYHPVISSVAMLREKEVERLLEMCQERFSASSVNLNAILALLVGGIYAVVLQSKTGNSPMCGIDVSREADQQSLRDAIGQILEWAWDASEPPG
ncbi:TetR/AcrR family transcriptional regulator [Paradesertivirga mongoliensis]|uniref:TetR/AcrR family transcriptional regulator n=1 Tax=Paradesertivirga mongoliensis TaxID=2100740 RepID=A0ABW4ZR97_9SPHI|nr:TetR/AcrR family transcriptional regulator [Pedobacter mongoliensis]